MKDKLTNFITEELMFEINNTKIIKKLNGLNNNCYRIKYLSVTYFIRIAHPSNTYNPNEEAILNKCAKHNISPKLYYYDNYSKNMALQWFDGKMPTEVEFSSKAFINKLVPKLKTIHSFNFTNKFNPFAEIASNLNLCIILQLELPHYIDELLNTLNEIEKYCTKHTDYGFCHNDLNPSNILISTDNLYIIDYEFSAIGDIFYDLATLSWMMSSDGREHLLRAYFNKVTQYHYKKLAYYLFVVKFWNASWSLLKSRNNSSNYNYKKGAEMIFEDLRQNYL